MAFILAETLCANNRHTIQQGVGVSIWQKRAVAEVLEDISTHHSTPPSLGNSVYCVGSSSFSLTTAWPKYNLPLLDHVRLGTFHKE
jgi:hypothetical protein